MKILYLQNDVHVWPNQLKHLQLIITLLAFILETLVNNIMYLLDKDSKTRGIHKLHALLLQCKPCYGAAFEAARVQSSVSTPSSAGKCQIYFPEGAIYLHSLSLIYFWLIRYHKNGISPLPLYICLTKVWSLFRSHHFWIT